MKSWSLIFIQSRVLSPIVLHPFSDQYFTVINQWFFQIYETKGQDKISNYLFRCKEKTTYLHKACNKIKHTHFVVFPNNRKLHFNISKQDSAQENLHVECLKVTKSKQTPLMQTKYIYLESR